MIPYQRAHTVSCLKTDLRICHIALDDELSDQVDACLADLVLCGVVDPAEEDPNILSALKLWCRAAFTDDTTKAAAYTQRYNEKKAVLMMAEGYGGAADDD